ncbi:MAG: hypothetical protein M3Q30_21745 [Actinomycetota bacterium]|nr:hypothetical protein [Actinomycetota bacterium]
MEIRLSRTRTTHSIVKRTAETLRRGERVLWVGHREAPAAIRAAEPRVHAAVPEACSMHLHDEGEHAVLWWVGGDRRPNEHGLVVEPVAYWPRPKGPARRFLLDFRDDGEVVVVGEVGTPPTQSGGIKPSK